MTPEEHAEIMHLPTENLQSTPKKKQLHIDDLNIPQEKLLRGRISLADAFPEIAAQWHPTKNGDIKASDVPKSSNIIAWWQAACGHEWDQRVSARVHPKAGHTCPICTGKRLQVGYNDIMTRAPEIAKQWHPTKNNGLQPENFTYGSGFVAWWRGDCGHEWQAAIWNRVVEKTGCPICQNKKLLAGFNDLETCFPEIAREWHPTKNGTLQPCDVVFGTTQKVWWQCTYNHEWEVSVSSRTQHHTGCPHCSQQTSFNEQALFYYAKQMCPDALNRVKIQGKEADIYISSLNAVFEYDGWFHNETRICADIQKAHHMQKQGKVFFCIREPGCPRIEETFGEYFYLHSMKTDEIESAVRWFLHQLNGLNNHLNIPDVDLQRDESVIHAKLTNHKKTVR